MIENKILVTKKVTVYFDGLCHLCSREINHYRSMKGSDNINFVDITGTDFDSFREGLDPIQIHKVMHVRDSEGNIHLGVDAFFCIWSQLPALQFLVPIVRIGFIRFVLKLFYSAFAKLRPFLPRKSCESSPFCETHLKP